MITGQQLYDRDRHLRLTYSIDEGRYQAMLAAQGGHCRTCPTRRGDPGQRTSLGVDHDRGCCPGLTSCRACVRGLRCTRCNWLVGIVESRANRLRIPAIHDYLGAVAA